MKTVCDVMENVNKKANYLYMCKMFGKTVFSQHLVYLATNDCLKYMVKIIKKNVHLINKCRIPKDGNNAHIVLNFNHGITARELNQKNV